jgi:dUTP pyrophosphatase
LDYRGEVTMRFKHIKDTDDYNVGDRIGQLIIVPYPQVTFEEVSELDETVRGTGGYGSTG